MENESKSKTPMLIGIVVVVLVLAGGFILLNSTQNSPQPTTRPSTTTTLATNSPASTADSDVQTISITGANFRFSLSEIKVKKGQKVKIELTANDMKHDFVIDELNVKSETAEEGESVEVEFTPTEAGEFQYYCSTGEHKAKGMVGTLIVE